MMPSMAASDETDDDGWKDVTRLAIAQVTARSAELSGLHDGLSREIWVESVTGNDPQAAMKLALRLFNLSLILGGRLASAEETTPEAVLQSIAPFAA
jgi:hypothetical protein